MRYLFMTAILSVACCASVAHGQACFLDNGYSAIGAFLGGASSEEHSSGYGGILVSQNARADFSLGLQSMSFDHGSSTNILQQFEFLVLRQRQRGAPFFWSIGQSFIVYLPSDDNDAPRQNIFGCFSTLSRSISLDRTASIRPAAGAIWQKATDADSPAEWGGMVSLDFAGGSGNDGTLFVATIAATDSFGPGGQTSISFTLSLTGVKEHRGR